MIFRNPRRPRRVATILAATVAAMLAVQPDARAACRGSDMLAELARTDPALHARIASESKAVPHGNALLWKVEKQGQPASHLFGTIHVTDARVTAHPKAVTDAIHAAKVVALEVADISADAMAKAMGTSSNLLLLTDGRRLDKLLDAKEFEQLKSVTGRMGMPDEAAAMFRPWVLYMMLSIPDCEQRQVQAGKPVLDQKLADAAKARGIPVKGLETIEKQLAAMAAVPEHEQLAMLKLTLAAVDRREDQLETLLQLYLGRNIGATWPLQMAMAEKAGMDKRIFDGFRRELITKRNLAMRDAALPLLGKGPVFIGVGALHLPGDDGLVNLLQQAGYTLTAVE